MICWEGPARFGCARTPINTVSGCEGGNPLPWPWTSPSGGPIQTHALQPPRPAHPPSSMSYGAPQSTAPGIIQFGLRSIAGTGHATWTSRLPSIHSGHSGRSLSTPSTLFQSGGEREWSTPSLVTTLVIVMVLTHVTVSDLLPEVHVIMFLPLLPFVYCYVCHVLSCDVHVTFINCSPVWYWH